MTVAASAGTAISDPTRRTQKTDGNLWFFTNDTPSGMGYASLKTGGLSWFLFARRKTLPSLSQQG